MSVVASPLARVKNGNEPAYLSYKVSEAVAWIMLERPEVANAQNYGLLNQLDDLFRLAVDDIEVKVIVLGGRGRRFSAGHDLNTPDKNAAPQATSRSATLGVLAESLGAGVLALGINCAIQVGIRFRRRRLSRSLCPPLRVASVRSPTR